MITRHPDPRWVSARPTEQTIHSSNCSPPAFLRVVGKKHQAVGRVAGKEGKVRPRKKETERESNFCTFYPDALKETVKCSPSHQKQTNKNSPE